MVSGGVTHVVYSARSLAEAGAGKMTSLSRAVLQLGFCNHLNLTRALFLTPCSFLSLSNLV